MYIHGRFIYKRYGSRWLRTSSSGSRQKRGANVFDKRQAVRLAAGKRESGNRRAPLPYLPSIDSSRQADKPPSIFTVAPVI
jgi:hypothetical protein